MKKREFFGSMLLLGAALGMPWPAGAGTACAPASSTVVLQSGVLAELSEQRAKVAVKTTLLSEQDDPWRWVQAEIWHEAGAV